MAENFKPSDTKPIVEKEETKNVITRQKIGTNIRITRACK
jgi:hypothetical protein